MQPLSLAVLVGLLLLLGGGLIFLSFVLLQLISKAWVVLIISAIGFLLVWIIIRLLSRDMAPNKQGDYHLDQGRL
jgi:hypothetical protein